MFYLGLDLGQANDYTALVLLEKLPLPAKPAPPPPVRERATLRPMPPPNGSYSQSYFHPRRAPVPQVGPLHVRHLQRYQRGTAYPVMVSEIAERLTQAPLKGKAKLVVDGTGVGRAVVDLFRDKLQGVIPITITAGGVPLKDDLGYWRVSKRDLIGTVQVLLQTERLKIAAEIPEANMLIHELQNYEVQITASANDVYNAREGQHDDLVLALALAAWWAERPEPVYHPPVPSVSYSF